VWSVWREEARENECVREGWIEEGQLGEGTLHINFVKLL